MTGENPLVGGFSCLLHFLVFDWEPAGACRDGVPERSRYGEFGLLVQVEFGLDFVFTTVFHFLEPIRVDDEFAA